ncbi:MULTISPECIES: hypothetical protein [Thermus]|jgi:hypothetical protein|uniref:hypothetical protein n=1 Tax=Thermus sp. TaxID=275 RepID=UPI0030B2316C
MIAASRLALTTALFWLAAAGLVGLLLGLGLLPYAWRPAHAHMNLLGFVGLMIYGVAYHALPRFRGVVFRRPGVALFQVLLANLALLGMALAWGLGLMGLWGVFALLEYVALLLFVLLMLEVLWR